MFSWGILESISGRTPGGTTMTLLRRKRKNSWRMFWKNLWKSSVEVYGGISEAIYGWFCEGKPGRIFLNESLEQLRKESLEYCLNESLELMQKESIKFFTVIFEEISWKNPVGFFKSNPKKKERIAIGISRGIPEEYS